MATDPVAATVRMSAGRRRQRTLGSICSELVAFASLSTSSETCLRVLCVGADFGWYGGARAGFPFRELYRLLSQHCLVVQCCEFRTSSFCPCCNGKLSHPTDVSGQPILGSVYCPAPACGLGHIFLNRDTLGALNIGLKFVYERVFGDFAGVFSRFSDAKAGEAVAAPVAAAVAEVVGAVAVAVAVAAATPRGAGRRPSAGGAAVAAAAVAPVTQVTDASMRSVNIFAFLAPARQQQPQQSAVTEGVAAAAAVLPGSTITRSAAATATATVRNSQQAPSVAPQKIASLAR